MDYMKQALLKSMKSGVIYANIKSILLILAGGGMLIFLGMMFCLGTDNESWIFLVILAGALLILLLIMAIIWPDVKEYKLVKAGIEDGKYEVRKGQIEKYYVHMPTIGSSAVFDSAHITIDGITYNTDKNSAYHCTKGDCVIYITGFVWQGKVTTPVAKIKNDMF